MPAAKKIKTIRKLGLIAGGGLLPALLVSECQKQNIEVFIIGFKGQTDPQLMAMAPHKWAALGAVGTILDSFKQNNIRDLVLIGRIRRPSLREIRPDFTAAKILTRIGFRALGDNGLLSALRKELETEGFKLHGIHEFCEGLLAKEGAYSKLAPDAQQTIDIGIGLEASQNIGRMDIGQSVVVQDGVVLGLEGAEGTDELIRRCSLLQKAGGKGPILIKTCKPQQDRDLDMPTIGPDTIETAHESGFSGIVFQAGATLVVDPKTIEDLANRYKMFVQAVDLKPA